MVMVAWGLPPSPDGAVAQDAAASEEAEAARRVLVPPDALVALPRPFIARRQLNRLARALRRRGWTVDRRYAETCPMLRVFFPDMPCLGDSVTVAGGDGGWWYRSSTGELLAPCADMDLAVTQVTTALERWIAMARSSWGTDGA
ncbi:hypothetical protein E1293_31280 [Actinomadura darangshiensis]|uniref:Uncharacterized protein n=1 Tax=Actinomadura darangshiensis TaxID=705336 RepID=A0A4R5AP03_9ACTN|nr:hypothetical protein [Actinomadura darangshiensis]TDD73490.1 hypothetical protein E1293_31280 [Actinomadura darangshiensis]